MPRRLTKDEFIKQLSIEHPELELLSDYNGNKNYITVRCKKHDHIFTTKPNWLHSGHGCQKCYDERRGDTTRKTLEECIKQSREVHGDKYDYSEVKYINNHTHMAVICPKHGRFWVTPSKHIHRKQGCRKCADERNGINRRLKFSEMLKRAREKHGDKYEYDESTYVSMEVDMRIICPIHGEFWQTPYLHTTGCGCPFCHESRLERQVNLTFPHLVRQKKFDWLGQQSLDFFDEENNIAIECQGKQHFFPVNHFGGEEGFNIIMERDIRKKKLLEENNIRLYYLIDDDVKIENLPSNIYNIENTLHLNELDNLKELLV